MYIPLEPKYSPNTWVQFTALMNLVKCVQMILVIYRRLISTRATMMMIADPTDIASKSGESN